MYAWPIAFPAQTNREDLQLTLSLFDDDTGNAIDLSGRTLAAPGDFTGANWIVQIGTIVTASASALTIKDYPIQGEMQALALVVGAGLVITAGDLVNIADPTGLNTMQGTVTSYAPATGALVCQIGCAFEFEIRGSHGSCDSGYGPNWAIGQAQEVPLISAQLGAGVTLIDVGIVEVRIPAATMAKLHHKTYGAAMIAYDGTDTRQLFTGSLPILKGGTRALPLTV
ncbi:hypothetical protein ACRAVF_27310 [Bradyrhizobium oligotrophicum S58]